MLLLPGGQKQRIAIARAILKVSSYYLDMLVNLGDQSRKPEVDYTELDYYCP